MSSEGDKGLEELIDGVWTVFFDRLKKKEVPIVRSTLGDELNLFIPQMRLLLPIYANPRFPISIYTSSYLGARRNSYTILRKLDMPPDFFWKFEFWTNERAFEVLSKIINRIFSEIMRTTKEGLLSVENASTDPEEIKIMLALDECVECLGIKANHPLCYYHTGTLTGIISALLKKELDGYETSCCATGGEKCEFVVGTMRGKKELDEYLNPSNIEFQLPERLRTALSGERLRSLGNETDLRYYHLVILNTLFTNPKVFSASSHEIGVEYGKRLAQFLEGYYQKKDDELLGGISDYYKSLKHLQVEVKEGAGEIRAAEVAEIAGLAQNEDLLAFLFGELEGILSAILKEKVVYTGKALDGNEVVLRFKKQG
jgi:hypothetical protein